MTAERKEGGIGVEIKTAQYQFSHGKAPSGRGYWAFQVGAETFWSNPNQLYSQAKLDAVRLAISRGLSFIEVMP